MAKPSTPTKPPGKTVKEYIDEFPDRQRKILSSLVSLVHEAAPDAVLSIKWGQPVFDQNGPFCYIRAFKEHVNLGFWRGVDISSGKGALESGGQMMAHIKIKSEKDIKKSLFQDWVKEAVQLNQTRGDPTKNKYRK